MVQAVDPKQPSEILDYDIECAKDMSYGDSVASASVSISGPDDDLLVEAAGPVAYSDSVIKLRLSGGTNLKKYKVTLVIVTLNGLVVEGDFTIRIKDE